MVRRSPIWLVNVDRVPSEPRRGDLAILQVVVEKVDLKAFILIKIGDLTEVLAVPSFKYTSVLHRLYIGSSFGFRDEPALRVIARSDRLKVMPYSELAQNSLGVWSLSIWNEGG
jgi:hypothetical protein